MKQAKTSLKSVWNPTLFLVLFLFIFLSFNIVLISAQGTYPAVNPNMVLYYHFNNDSSVGENYNGDLSIINDYSNHVNGTTYNLTGLYNKTGGYLGDGVFNFNNSINWINVTRNSLFNSSNFTWSIWVNKYSDSEAVISMGTANDNNKQVRIKISGGGALFRIANSTENGYTEVSFGTFNNYEWHLLTVTYQLNGTITTYVDGTLIYIGTQIGGHINMSNSELNIGKLTWGGTTYSFNGSVDDFIIYNKSLTQTEVQQLYLDYTGCITPVEDLTISYSNAHVKLCSGDYYLNDTNNNGVISLTGSNLNVTCNGTRIIGNWSGQSGTRTAIKINSANNIILKNCYLSDFWYQVLSQNSNNITLDNITAYRGRNNIYMSNDTNINLINSNITNSSYSNIIYILSTSPSQNINISNNYISESFYTPILAGSVSGMSVTYNTLELRLAELSNVSNSHFDYNNLYNPQLLISGSKFIYAINGINNTYRGNNLTFTKNLYYGFWLHNESNSNISYNTFYNGTSWANILLTGGSGWFGNNTISYNNITWTDTGLDIECSNNFIHHNIINYSVLGYDGYYISLKINQGNNNLIYNNTMYNCGLACILMRNSSNNIIYFNYLDNNPISNLGVKFGIVNFSTYEYSSAIKTTPMIKTWTSDSNGVTNSSQNLTDVIKYVSNNNTMYGNTYGSNVQVFYSDMGGSNNNFSDALSLYFWFRSFQFPAYLLPKQSLWINNNFNNLTQGSWSGGIGNGTVGLLNQMGIANQFTVDFYVTKNYIYSINRYRNSSNPIIQNNNHNYFNLSSPLISFSNGTSIYQSGTNLQYNFSLAPNEYVYVFENHNCSDASNITLIKSLISTQQINLAYSQMGCSNICGSNQYMDANYNCVNLPATNWGGGTAGSPSYQTNQTNAAEINQTSDQFIEYLSQNENKIFFFIGIIILIIIALAIILNV